MKLSLNHKINMFVETFVCYKIQLTDFLNDMLTFKDYTIEDEIPP